ncbi:hypothetical protein PF001_g26563 [Phytophthora fragariae]|uniref:Uncharacterized protein n=1 Tax=Phytophthora fragariae TaxID=53985 RepID=A0A6A4BN76_9STRA|nr:hypothetical protein PF001_g26563 [Phytophthora fragariae]
MKLASVFASSIPCLAIGPATDMAIRERLATVAVPTTRIFTAGLCWPV